MKKPVAVAVCSCILFTMMIGMSGCKGLKKLTGNQSEAKAWKTILKKADTNRADYETMSMSGRANIEMADGPIDNLSASYQIYIQKDSLILIRIRKFVEVMRILITEDSIFIRDNINRNLMVSDYSLAEKQTGFEANIQLLQDLLIGNFAPIPDVLFGEPRESEDVQIFKGTKLTSEFRYDISLQNYKLLRIETDDPEKNQHTEVNYGDFINVGGNLLPKNTQIKVSAPDSLSLDFQHKKLETNPSNISFKFTVPDGYERINIQ